MTVFSNAASKLYISSVPINVDLDEAGFELLDWVEIKGIGNHGEAGKNTNILTYDTWDTTVIQKAKGMTDAGSPELECARIFDDPGQILLRAGGAVGNNNAYAFKMERNDSQNGGAPTIVYNRGLVTGPRRPLGRNEDFDLEVFGLAFVQEEVVTDPTTSGNPPVFEVAPAYTGASSPPEAGETITVTNGTVSGDATIVYQYQWYRNGVVIAGATNAALVIPVGYIGSVLQARVRAVNGVGSAIAFAPMTAAIVSAS